MAASGNTPCDAHTPSPPPSPARISTSTSTSSCYPTTAPAPLTVAPAAAAAVVAARHCAQSTTSSVSGLSAEGATVNGQGSAACARVATVALAHAVATPPDVTPAYKKAPRTDKKSPGEFIMGGKWGGYTPPPMPKE